MRTLLKYFRWLFRHSEGVRWSLFWNIFLGIFNVAVSLTYIYLCKRLVDIATGDAAGNIIWYTVAVLVLIGVRLAVTAVNVRIENLVIRSTGGDGQGSSVEKHSSRSLPASCHRYIRPSSHTSLPRSPEISSRFVPG